MLSTTSLQTDIKEPLSLEKSSLSKPSDTNVIPPNDSYRRQVTSEVIETPLGSSLQEEKGSSVSVLDKQDKKYTVFKVGSSVKIIRNALSKLSAENSNELNNAYIAEIVEILKINGKYLRRDTSFRLIYGLLVDIFTTDKWSKLSNKQLDSIKLQLGVFTNGNSNNKMVHKALSKIIHKGVAPQPITTSNESE